MASNRRVLFNKRPSAGPGSNPFQNEFGDGDSKVSCGSNPFAEDSNPLRSPNPSDFDSNNYGGGIGQQQTLRVQNQNVSFPRSLSNGIGKLAGSYLNSSIGHGPMGSLGNRNVVRRTPQIQAMQNGRSLGTARVSTIRATLGNQRITPAVPRRKIPSINCNIAAKSFDSFDPAADPNLGSSPGKKFINATEDFPKIEDSSLPNPYEEDTALNPFLNPDPFASADTNTTTEETQKPPIPKIGTILKEFGQQSLDEGFKADLGGLQKIPKPLRATTFKHPVSNLGSSGADAEDLGMQFDAFNAECTLENDDVNNPFNGCDDPNLGEISNLEQNLNQAQNTRSLNTNLRPVARNLPVGVSITAPPGKNSKGKLSSFLPSNHRVASKGGLFSATAGGGGKRTAGMTMSNLDGRERSRTPRLPNFNGNNIGTGNGMGTTIRRPDASPRRGGGVQRAICQLHNKERVMPCLEPAFNTLTNEPIPGSWVCKEGQECKSEGSKPRLGPTTSDNVGVCAEHGKERMLHYLEFCPMSKQWRCKINHECKGGSVLKNPLPKISSHSPMNKSGQNRNMYQNLNPTTNYFTQQDNQNSSEGDSFNNQAEITCPVVPERPPNILDEISQPPPLSFFSSISEAAVIGSGEEQMYCVRHFKVRLKKFLMQDEGGRWVCQPHTECQ